MPSEGRRPGRAPRPAWYLYMRYWIIPLEYNRAPLVPYQKGHLVVVVPDKEQYPIMMPEIMFQLSNLGWGWNFVILALFGPFLVICSFAQWPTAVFNYAASLDQNIPTESKPPGHDFRGTMKEGIMKVSRLHQWQESHTYPAQYKDQAWRIPFKDPTVILPHSTLQAVKKIPEPDITLNGNMYQRFFGRYTQIGTDDQELVEALKLDLTHSVPNVLGVMADEVAFGYQSVVGQPEEWTSFSTYQAMLRIVALTSGRIFVGLPLSRQEDWIEASTQHTLGSVWLSDKLRGYSPWLRPFIAPFLKERKEVQKVQDTVAKLLEPLITSRVLEMTGLDQKSPSRTDEERGRMLDWLLSRYSRKVPPNIDPQRLVRDHLTLSFAAIHVAGMALTHILHDLASKPEYIGILRSELDIEIDKCPGEVINSRALANLVKMDSFIKESLRVNPAGIGKKPGVCP
jgi:hypothetical protein